MQKLRQSESGESFDRKIRPKTKSNMASFSGWFSEVKCSRNCFAHGDLSMSSGILISISSVFKSLGGLEVRPCKKEKWEN